MKKTFEESAQEVAAIIRALPPDVKYAIAFPTEADAKRLFDRVKEILSKADNA